VKLGFARRDITPDRFMPGPGQGTAEEPDTVPMAGYLFPRSAVGVHDRLYVRALAFSEKGKQTVVILQMDLLNLDALCMERLYRGMTELNLDKKNLLVCPIHTHSGFGGFFSLERGINREMEDLLGSSRPALADLVVTQSLTAIKDALKNGVETTVRMNKGTLEGLGTNRHDPGLPCDQDLFMMEFYRMDGKKVLVYNLCCHPTVMNAANLYLSADFAGAAAEKLEGPSGAYAMAVFINGSAGDMSTRFTRNGSTFEECLRYGDLIVKTLEALKKGTFLPLEKVDLRYHRLALQRAETPDPEEAQAHLDHCNKGLEELRNQEAGSGEIRKAASLVEGARIQLLKARYTGGNATVQIEAGILTINTTIIVCSPFELFSTLVLALKREKHIEMFGYVNELFGYLADREAYDSMDYEALFSEFKRGEGERYIELISTLL
jgi:hypothetical protein